MQSSYHVVLLNNVFDSFYQGKCNPVAKGEIHLSEYGIGYINLSITV